MSGTDFANTGGGYEDPAGYGTARDSRWWLRTEDKHKSLITFVRRIRFNQSYRNESYLRFARLYGNLPLLGFGVGAYTRIAATQGYKLAYNVVKNCADTYTAKMSKNKPKPTFITSGGDWGLQQKAKLLDKFVEGQFYEANLYEILPTLVLDTCVFGTGILKLFINDKKRLECERTFPWECLTDDAESLYGCPRSFYQTKYYDRAVLEEIFPKHRAEIHMTKKDADDRDHFEYDSTADQVMVVEAWHLRSSPTAKDGRHVIAVENATLLDEAWDGDYFPFVFLRRYKPLIGFWGTGLAEELTGIQIEINTLLRKIQRSHNLLAAGHWLVEKGSKIDSHKMNNEIGSIIGYSGMKPELQVGQSVHPEIYEHLETLYKKAYEISGVSQMEAQAQRPPPGVEAGKAIRALSDIASERFIVGGRELELFVLEVAKQMIDRAREISAMDSSFGVKAHSRHFLQQIKWKEVDLQDDEYVMKMWPTSALANEPWARLSQVQEMAQAGWLSPEDAKRLLDFPDLEKQSDYENANYDLIMKVIDKMLTTGKYFAPRREMNLAEDIKRVQLAALRAEVEDAPEDRIDLLRQWMAEAVALMKPPAPPPGAPTMAPPGPPAAVAAGPAPAPPTPQVNPQANGVMQ